jgi:hypothetical protein
VSNGRQSLPAIAFRQGHLAGEFSRGDRVDVVYRPTINEWQGERTLQLLVAAIRPAAGDASA